MSYPPPPPYGAPPPPLPGQAPRPPRPTTVTLAAAALFGEVALFVIGAIVSVLTSDTVRKATDDYADAHNASSGSGFTAGEAFGIFVGLIYAVIMVGLALGILRGLNVVRIIAWVVCGLSICCVGISTISTSVILSKYLPGGYLAYLYVNIFLELVGFIAAIVLLALRPSNAYFNPRSQQQPF